MADRGQLSLSTVEAVIGTVLILGVVAGFTIGLPDPGRERARLDRYAADAATALAEHPGGGAGPLLARAISSPARFEASRSRLRAHVASQLPDAVLFRLRTPHGTVGFPRPPGAPSGDTIVTTTSGRVRLVVWYG